MITIYKDFSFEAAHRAADGQVWGHSFIVHVVVAAAESNPNRGIAIPVALDDAIRDVRDRLDHRFLNEIEGLHDVTFETLAQWIFNALAPSLPHIVEVCVQRPSTRDGCVYRAPPLAGKVSP